MEKKLDQCAPEDISLKTFFLGPQAENREWVMGAVEHLFREWFRWRQNCFPGDGEAISIDNRRLPEFLAKQNQLMDHLKSLIRRFEDEVPKFTPRYVGHMLSEQSLPALLGHILTLLHNPNNVSGEASRVGIQIEQEAIEDLCTMVGWPKQTGMGHFTSGGTLANFEGLLRAKNRFYQWLALGTFLREKKILRSTLFEVSHMGWAEFDRQLGIINLEEFSRWKKHWLANPVRFARHVGQVFDVEFDGPVVLVSQSKHYSWPKATQLLGMGSDRLIAVDLDEHGRMDLNSLREAIENCRRTDVPICAVVSVAGTTELGTVDPIQGLVQYLAELRSQNIDLWHHVDAAYGGFLCSMIGLGKDHVPGDLLDQLAAICHANSITIDPHKLGYVPYASGVILVRQQREYAYQEIDAPYIQFEKGKDVGLQTLEGSRSAAGAVATWLTERSIGLNADGYGRILARTIMVKQLIQKMLAEADPMFLITEGLDTNVLCLSVGKPGQSLSAMNRRVQAIFSQMSPGQNSAFIISKTRLNLKNYRRLLQHFTTTHHLEADSENVELLRLVLMNPFMVSKETNVFYPEALVRELVSRLDESPIKKCDRGTMVRQ